MKTSRTLLLTLALASLAFSAVAQRYVSFSPVTMTNLQFAASGLTNGLAPYSTNTVSGIFDHVGAPALDVRRQTNVAVQCWAQPRLSNSVALKFLFAPSLDNATFDYANPITVTLAGTTNAAGPAWVGTTAVLNVGGIGWLRLFEIANTDYNASATNCWLIYSIKR